MKLITVGIDGCCECPYREQTETLDRLTALTVHYCCLQVGGKEIPDVATFPVWCPLPEQTDTKQHPESD